MKEKKITIKFFINKQLKPIAKAGKDDLYPLYVQVTYDRKNMQFKSFYGEYYKDLEEVDKLRPGLIKFEENIIRKTVQYERAIQGDNFELKGIKDKYVKYSQPIFNLLDGHLKKELLSTVRHSTNREFAVLIQHPNEAVDFGLCYSGAMKLFDDLQQLQSSAFELGVSIYQEYKKLYGYPFFKYDFLTVIDWLDKTAIIDYSHKLTKLADIKTKDSKVDYINDVIYEFLD